MRTIKDLAVPQNTDPKFPFGSIKNETDTEDGTPVVEEIYGDIITNAYKLLQSVGIVPTETQDSDTSQYQILEALKLLPNSLNDIEQVLSLNATTWSVSFNLDYLPNKYFFVARASEDYVAGTSYKFKGTTDTEYNFSSSGFKASDEILVIIDASGVRAYSLSFLGNTSSEVFTVMGTPVAFNDTNKVYYQEGGQLISDAPSVSQLENIIRVDLSDGTILLNDMLVMNGYVLCFCYNQTSSTYLFRQFNLNNLSVSLVVNLVGATLVNATDFMPYVFAKQGEVYLTNGANSSANDYLLSKFNYTPASGNLTFVSTTTLDASFVKTSNAAIKNGLLYTMVLGILESYNLSSGVKASLGSYSGIAGQLFGFNSEVYYGNGDVAKKWF